MPPRQERPALAGGLGTGLQPFSPAFLALTRVTGEKLARLVPSFEAACASTESVLRRPPLHIPRMSATQSMGRLPLSPWEACHPIHRIPATQST